MIFKLESLKDIARIIKELSVGLRNLDFTNNFETFEISDIIGTGSTIIVRNQFNALPTHWILTDNTGDGVISRGETWDANYLSFKNNGTIDATIKIVVYRR